MGWRERRSENLHMGVVRGTWPGSTGQKRDPGRAKGEGKVKGDGQGCSKGPDGGETDTAETGKEEEKEVWSCCKVCGQVPD